MFDPYHKWLGIRPDQRPPTYYQLLGIAPDEKDREVIEEAAIRQTTHVRTYQIGPHAADCTRYLNEIAKARTTLIDPAKRKDYDAGLAQKMIQAVPPSQPPVREAITAAPPIQAPATASPQPFDFLSDAPEVVTRPTAAPERKSLAREPRVQVVAGGRKGILVAAIVASIVLPLLGLGILFLVFLFWPKPGPSINPSQASATKFETPPTRSSVTGSESVATTRKMIDPIKPPDPIKPAEPVVVNPDAAGRRLQGDAFGTQDLLCTPDGKQVLSSHGNSVKLWDLATGQLLRTHQVEAMATMRCMAISPDGKRLAIGGGNTVQKDQDSPPMGQGCRFQVVDLQTWQPICTSAQLESPIICVAFSLDGRQLAFGGGLPVPQNKGGQFRDCTVRIWDVDNDKQIQQCPGHQSFVNAVAFTADGRQVYSCGMDNTLRHWNVATGMEIPRQDLQNLNVQRKVVFTPDGRYLLASNGNVQEVVRLELQTGKQVTLPIPGPKKSFLGVAISKDGRFAAIGGGQPRRENGKIVRNADGSTVYDDCLLYILDLDKGNSVAQLAGHNRSIRAVALSADGQSAVSGGADRFLIHWDLTKSPPPVQVEKPSPRNQPAEELVELRRLRDTTTESVAGLGLMPDAKQIAVMHTRSVNLQDATGGPTSQGLAGIINNTVLRCLAVSPDGKQALVGTGSTTMNQDKVVTIRECKVHLVDAQKWQIAFSSADQPAPILSAAFSPDGRKFVTGTSGIFVAMDNQVTYRDCIVSIWDAETHKLLHTCTGHTRAISAVVFSPDGKRVYSAGSDQSIRVWDVDSGKQVGSYPTTHSVSPGRGAFTPDCRYLVGLSPTQDNRLYRMHIETGKETKYEPAQLQGGTRAMKLAPDGRHVLLADSANPSPDKPTRNPDGTPAFQGCTFSLIDLETGQCVARAEKSATFVRQMCFSADGRYAASASTDRTIILWDLTRRVPVVQTPEKPPLATQNPLDKLDPARIAPEDRPKGIKEVVAVLKGHKDEVWGVAFAPDGQRLATASKDGTVGLWDLSGTEPRSLARIELKASQVSAVEFSADGKTLAFLTSTGCQLHDVSAAAPKLVADLPITSAFKGLCFVPARKTFAITSKAEIQLVDPTGKNRDRLPLKGFTTQVRAMAFAPDGQSFATAGEDRQIRLWDWRGADPAQRYSFQVPANVCRMDFNLDGKALVIGCYDGSVHMWDIGKASPRSRASAKEHPQWADSVDFAPDGKSFLSTEGGTRPTLAPRVIWWNATDGKKRHEWVMPERCSQGVFAPTGQFVALTCHNQNVYILRLPPESP